MINAAESVREEEAVNVDKLGNYSFVYGMLIMLAGLAC